MGNDSVNNSDVTLRPIMADGSLGEPIIYYDMRYLEDPPVEEVHKEKIPWYTGTISGVMDIRYPHQKISRKTFKKWLMAYGFSRNNAELTCRLISMCSGKISYQSVYVGHYFEMLLNKLGNL